MAVAQFALPLPALPEGWSADKDFKGLGHLSSATQRTVEPVGPHFLAHARRKRHKRTFSEDERLEAQKTVKKIEDEDAGEISEPEDPLMLQRDPKDWKVDSHFDLSGLLATRANTVTATRPLCRPWSVQVPPQGLGRSDQEGAQKESAQAPPGQEGCGW